MKRYSRQIVLQEVGQKGQDKLSRARVLVVGAGGLGCPVLQYLAAAGIGTLGILDSDEVEESNLQRQVLYGTSSLGENKALAAKMRLEDLNPGIELHAHQERLTGTNALFYFKKYDIIVDATDNFESRYLINDAALLTNRPVVYGAIYKYEGQVSVFNFRKGPSYRCVFPEPPKKTKGISCSETGVLGVLPAIIGSMQANEVLKMILGFKEVLSGRLYCFNAKTNESHFLRIRKNEKKIAEYMNKPLSAATFYCDNRVHEITAEEALKKDPRLFIDVREADEEPTFNFQNCRRIALGEIKEKIASIEKRSEIILFCQSGVRSKKAVQILSKHEFQNIYSLEGGAPELYKAIKKKGYEKENSKKHI